MYTNWEFHLEIMLCSHSISRLVHIVEIGCICKILESMQISYSLGKHIVCMESTHYMYA